MQVSDAEKAVWILQGQCPGCGGDLEITHCRNHDCTVAHAALRAAIDRSPTLRDLELHEYGQGRNLYETLSIIWFDNYDG